MVHRNRERTSTRAEGVGGSKHNALTFKGTLVISTNGHDKRNVVELFLWLRSSLCLFFIYEDDSTDPASRICARGCFRQPLF